MLTDKDKIQIELQILNVQIGLVNTQITLSIFLKKDNLNELYHQLNDLNIHLKEVSTLLKNFDKEFDGLFPFSLPLN